MRFAAFFSALLLAANASAAIDWNADLDTLRSEIPKVHPNAFHATTKEAWEASIAKLRADAPNLPPHKVAAEIGRIVASIGDGHTRLTFPIDPKAGFFSGHSTTKIPDDPALHFRQLPLRFTWLSDGLVITAAANRDLVGHRVARIGTMTPEEAYKAMAPFAHGDNEAMRRAIASDYFAVPELLNAAGITPSKDSVTIDGTTVDAIPFDTDAAWLPKRDERNFWFEQRGKSVYFVFNEVNNEEKESLRDFAARLFKFIDDHKSDTLIIDLRANAGGNGGLLQPLVHGLIRRPNLRVFALIGPRTFSAAVDFALQLEQNTNTVFVGEPTGGRPNNYGDSRKITLPSSGMTVRVSTLYWQKSDPRDFRDTIPPHLTVVPSSTDLAAHRDLALQTTMHIADGIRKKGTLDGNWTGIITIEWHRIPLTIESGRLNASMLGIKDYVIQQPHFTIASTEGPLEFDLRPGAEVITGTMAGQGRVFPLLLTKSSAP